MSSSTGKTENDVSILGADPENCLEDSASRAGLPDKSSILEEKQFKSPAGRKYRILKTSEKDEYEESKSPPPPPLNDKRKR